MLPDIFQEYYSVSATAVSWTAMIASVTMALGMKKVQQKMTARNHIALEPFW